MEVLAPFRFITYVNDVRNFPGDETTDIVKRSQPRQIDVSVVQMFSPAKRTELRPFSIIAINDLKTIDRGEEFYVRHGASIHFLSIRQQLNVNKSYSSERAHLRYL